MQAFVRSFRNQDRYTHRPLRRRPMNPDDQPIPPPRTVQPRLSKQAVFAIVLAVLACCPMASLLGSIMGLAALGRIRRSQGRLRGKRLALAAAIAGFSLAVAASIGLTVLQQRVRDYS